jgi:uncharacterized protein
LQITERPALGYCKCTLELTNYMEKAIIGPVVQNKRVVIVDILRGWALLGVVIMNYSGMFYFSVSKAGPDAFNNFLIKFGFAVFEQKSWTMLSFLFGYGFAVLIENVTSKGINPVRFFLGRMFWLLVIAVIDSAIFFGDILKDYAVLGMIFLLFRNVSAKTAFYICLGLLFVTPPLTAFILSFKIDGFALTSPYIPLYNSHNLFDVLESGLICTYKYEMVWPFYSIVFHEVVLLCFLLGLAAQKINFFGRLAENKKYIKRTFWVTLGLALVLWVPFGFQRAPWLSEVFKYFNTALWLFLSTMIFMASAICWLYLAGKLKRFFGALQIYGRMTLTNYVVQNIIGLFLFSGFGLGLVKRHASYGVFMLIALAVYVSQIYVSKWWLSRYYYGPIEWIWRQLSYGRKLPIKRVRGLE